MELSISQRILKKHHGFQMVAFRIMTLCNLKENSCHCEDIFDNTLRALTLV